MTMADEEQLNALPTVAEAKNLPVAEYNRIGKGLLDHKTECFQFYAKFYAKFEEWCQYLQCSAENDPCILPPHPAANVPAVISTPAGGLPKLVTDAATAIANITSDLAGSLLSPGRDNNFSVTHGVSPSLVTQSPSTPHPIMRLLGYNGTGCYDDYMCDKESMAEQHHALLGVVCFILCLVGVLGNTVCIPAFNVAGNRSGATLYLTGMAVCDTLYLILATLIMVIRYLPSSYVDQLDMYARFTGYLVPHGLPALQLCELMVVWFMVALLVDRHLYLKFGFHSKAICSRSLSAKVMIFIFICLGVYTVPKFLQYVLQESKQTGQIWVFYTALGKNVTYRNLMTHWLKVPIEMFLPYLSISIFAVMVVIKMVDVQSSTKRKLNSSSAATNGCNGLDPNTGHYTVELEQMIYSKGGSVPPTNAHGIALKQMEARENANVTLAVVLGFLLLGFKLPKFVLHVLSTEDYVIHDPVVFSLINQLLDIIYAVCKPFICIAVGFHFRSAIVAMFCCCDVCGMTAAGVANGCQRNGAMSIAVVGNKTTCHNKDTATEMVPLTTEVRTDAGEGANGLETGGLTPVERV